MADYAPNPYPGLRAFRADERPVFFGREGLVDSLLEKLRRRRFLVVLGPAGCGKSSLVHAGLLPALMDGLMVEAGATWRIAACRPGPLPLRALARTLAEAVASPEVAGSGAGAVAIEASLRGSRSGIVDVALRSQLAPGTNLLVVVDQFEDVFRYENFRDESLQEDFGRAAAGTVARCDPWADDELPARDEATALVDLLLYASRQTALPIYVAITLRTDFLGRVTGFAGLVPTLNEAHFLVPRLTRDELQLAIGAPAAVHGHSLEGKLLQRLLVDLDDTPDALGRMQHALRRAWDEWRRDTGGSGAVALRHYLAIGTVAGAIDEHAEECWTGLNSDREREICRRVFQTLTTPVDLGHGLRRPAPLALLAAVAQTSLAEVRRVVDAFRGEDRDFLLPATPCPEDGELVDIASDLLTRLWVRLGAWMAAEEQSAQRLRGLVGAARERAQGGPLWRDPELETALQWYSAQAPNAAWAERYGGGLDAAASFLDESAQARDAEQALATRRSRERRFASAASLLALAVLGAASLLGWRRTKHELEAANANDAVKLVMQGRASFDLTLPTPLDLALQMSAAAFRLRVTNASYAGLQYALSNTMDVLRVLTLARPAVALSADGRLALGTDGDAASLYDATDGTPLGSALIGHVGAINAAAFSPDAHLLATAGEDSTVRLWTAGDARDRDLTLRGHTNQVFAVAFSPDGRVVASGDADGQVRLWDATTGKLRGVLLAEHGARVLALAFSPDGRMLASGSEDAAIAVWDWAKNPSHATAAVRHDGAVSALAFSPDSRWLASAGGGDLVRLWDAATGRPHGEPLRGHTSRIFCIAFSPDGTLLASGSLDQTLRLWDVVSGRPVGGPLLGHKSGVSRVVFGADGASLLSTAANGSLIRWTRTPGHRALQEQGSPIRSLAVSPDGHTLIVTNLDGSAREWSIAGWRPRGPSSDPRPAKDAALVEARLGNVDSIVAGDGGDTFAYSPDGRLLATAGSDATVRLWRVSGTAVAEAGTLRGHRQRVTALAFTATGAQLASASEDGSVRLWHMPDGVPRAQLEGHAGAVRSVAFSADGTTLASGGEDREIRFWDAATGEARGVLRAADTRPRDAAAFTSIAFAPDGRTLFSGTNDGELRAWDAPPAWIDDVCGKLAANMTRSEWGRLVGAIAYVAQCPALPVPDG